MNTLVYFLSIFFPSVLENKTHKANSLFFMCLVNTIFYL